MSIETLETYLNRNGFPIIRRCFNCKHWYGEIHLGDGNPAGYCKLTPMLFAFTLQKTVYPITRDFYLCEGHEFTNEDKLAQSSEKVSLKDSIKEKKDIK